MNPSVSMVRNNIIVINLNSFISFMVVDHGKIYEISKSNIRNSTPIKKNFIENGSRGVFRGSNPHSYIEIFSVLGILILISVDSVNRIVENLILIINMVIIGINSSCFMV